MWVCMLVSIALPAWAEESPSAPPPPVPSPSLPGVAPPQVAPGARATPQAPEAPAQHSTPEAAAGRTEHGAAPEFGRVLAQPGGLTALQAARRASHNSVEAAIQRQRVLTAESTRERVFWEAAPRLTLTARTTLLSEVEPLTFQGFGTFPQPTTNHFLNAGLVVPLSDYLLRTVQAVRGATTNREAALLDERAARVTAAANAKLAYYDWVRTRLEGVLVSQALSQAGAQLSRTQTLRSVGRSSEADVLQAQAFEADARLAVSQNLTGQMVAEERLRSQIQAPSNEPLSIGEDVLAEFPGAEEAGVLDELYREAVRQRLEMQSLDKAQAALRDVRRVESSGALPRFEAFGNLTYSNPNPRIFPAEERWNGTWDAGLQLVWTVNDVGTAGTRASAVRSQVAELEQRQRGVEQLLRVEVVSALGALNQARVSVATAEQGERAASAAYTARQRLQEQGMGTALELIQAETTRIRARSNLINAHVGLRVARVQLDHAVGRDVPSESPPSAP